MSVSNNKRRLGHIDNAVSSPFASKKNKPAWKTPEFTEVNLLGKPNEFTEVTDNHSIVCNVRKIRGFRGSDRNKGKYIRARNEEGSSKSITSRGQKGGGSRGQRRGKCYSNKAVIDLINEKICVEESFPSSRETCLTNSVNLQCASKDIEQLFTSVDSLNSNQLLGNKKPIQELKDLLRPFSRNSYEDLPIAGGLSFPAVIIVKGPPGSGKKTCLGVVCREYNIRIRSLSSTLLASNAGWGGGHGCHENELVSSLSTDSVISLGNMFIETLTKLLFVRPLQSFCSTGNFSNDSFITLIHELPVTLVEHNPLFLNKFHSCVRRLINAASNRKMAPLILFSDNSKKNKDTISKLFPEAAPASGPYVKAIEFKGVSETDMKKLLKNIIFEYNKYCVGRCDTSKTVAKKSKGPQLVEIGNYVDLDTDEDEDDFIPATVHKPANPRRNNVGGEYIEINNNDTGKDQESALKPNIKSAVTLRNEIDDKVAPVIISEIASAANGDIRFALNTVQLYMYSKTASSEDSINDEKCSSGSIMGGIFNKDNQHELFPILGKLLYNKRYPVGFSPPPPFSHNKLPWNDTGSTYTDDDELPDVIIGNNFKHTSQGNASFAVIHPPIHMCLWFNTSDFNDAVAQNCHSTSDSGLLSLSCLAEAFKPYYNYYYNTEYYDKSRKLCKLVFASLHCVENATCISSSDRQASTEPVTLERKFSPLAAYPLLSKSNTSVCYTTALERPTSSSVFPSATAFSSHMNEIEVALPQPRQLSAEECIPKLYRPPVYYNICYLIDNNVYLSNPYLFVDLLFQNYIPFFNFVIDCAAFMQTLATSNSIFSCGLVGGGKGEDMGGEASAFGYSVGGCWGNGNCNRKRSFGTDNTGEDIREWYYKHICSRAVIGCNTNPINPSRNSQSCHQMYPRSDERHVNVSTKTFGFQFRRCEQTDIYKECRRKQVKWRLHQQDIVVNLLNHEGRDTRSLCIYRNGYADKLALSSSLVSCDSAYIDILPCINTMLRISKNGANSYGSRSLCHLITPDMKVLLEDTYAKMGCKSENNRICNRSHGSRTPKSIANGCNMTSEHEVYNYYEYNKKREFVETDDENDPIES